MKGKVCISSLIAQILILVQWRTGSNGTRKTRWDQKAWHENIVILMAITSCKIGIEQWRI